MTRALLPLVGRSLLMLALCGAVVGCGDDDDDDGAMAGSGGKGGSGGKAGSGGKGGAGGAKVATKAECIEDFGDATPLPDACVECACDVNATAVAACGEECWALMVCVNTKCADVLADPAATQTCAGMMCETEIGAAAPLMMIAPAMSVGPILQGTKCASKCAPPPPPPGEDGGVDDDGGVDAGN